MQRSTRNMIIGFGLTALLTTVGVEFNRHAYIEKLETRVVALEKQVSEVESEIVILRTSNTKAITILDRLETSVSELNTSTKELSSFVNRLDERTLINKNQ